MNGNRYTLFAAFAVLVVAALFVLVLVHSSGEARARQTVEAFGQELQNTSLLAPDASSTIAELYAPYVDVQLLSTWVGDPSQAPGRTTSSPYPDHIDIGSITPQGAGYVITGEVVEMSSTGETGREPVVILVVPEESGYRIVTYQEQLR